MFHLCHCLVVHYSDPDDYSGITDEGTEHKEDTSNHPVGNSCDIVGIFGSAGDNIVVCVYENEDRGDEQTTSCRVGGGRNEEADPGDDDEQGGGQVVHQDVDPRVASEL